jgi:integrase
VERYVERSSSSVLPFRHGCQVADLEVSTREAHEGYIRRTIKPVLGQVKIRKLGADPLDALYAALKRCSRLCGRLPKTEHHADGRPPVRSPVRPAQRPPDEPAAPRVRPAMQTSRVQANEAGHYPADPLGHLLPPTPEQAARLLNLAFAEDEEFGLYLWLSFTTGGRGEMTGLREHRFDFARQRLRLADNYLVKSGQHIEKPPKDGDGRWVSVDSLTCDLFADWFCSRRAQAAEHSGTRTP